MRRRSGFLAGLAVAAITFGSLWFTLGPDHFNRGHKLCQREHCQMTEHCQKQCGEETKTIHADKIIIIQNNAKVDSIAK